ncbi:hypothetical protein FHY55_15755 [Oceanicola sp. D3]|uniref:hypothetical protein n=1 Tax=Oceanicola sp. D3 TaxID=2587163 RepID=UPI0011236150|nr:hypothetical protein [Oceanicola sp. D3]QDC10601.1 hypothetical protein FHY55_15755 [Oceanicola sp. D3]
MSDPMSNVEIEDVLSSIRRLVSENAARPRTGADAAPEGEEGGEDAGGADALLLTPSLRVEEDEAADAPEEASEAESPAPEVPAAEEAAEAGEPAEGDNDENALDASWQEVASPERALWREPETFEFETEAGEASAQAEAVDAEDPLQSRVEGLEAAFGAGDEYEPDGSEMAQGEEGFDWEEEGDEDTVIDLSTPDIPTGRLHFKPEAEEARPPEVIELGPPEEPAPLEPVEALVEPEEELADAPEEEQWPEPEEDWSAPDLPRPDDLPEPEPPLVFRSAQRPPVADAANENVAGPEPVVAEAPATEEPDEFDEESLAAYIAEADEEPVADPQFARSDARAEEGAADDMPFVEEGEGGFDADTPEAADEALDGYVVGTEAASGERDIADDADPWEDADFDEVDGAEAGPLTAAQGDEHGAPAIIDEALLTDLVSEVVRAELRGRMGERITQNVRKLVRREIARALETRGIR